MPQLLVVVLAAARPVHVVQRMHRASRSPLAAGCGCGCVVMPLAGVRMLFLTGGGGAMVLPEPGRQRVREQVFAGIETKDGANSAVGDRA